MSLNGFAGLDIMKDITEGYGMDELFLVKDGKITRYDGTTLNGNRISKEELVEAFGTKAFEEIERFGFYTIKKS
jgi:hypothetical protein